MAPSIDSPGSIQKLHCCPAGGHSLYSCPSTFHSSGEEFPVKIWRYYQQGKWILGRKTLYMCYGNTPRSRVGVWSQCAWSRGACGMRAKEYEESSGWHVLVSPMCACGFNSPSPCGIVDLLNSQEEKRRAHQCEENYTSTCYSLLTQAD